MVAGDAVGIELGLAANPSANAVRPPDELGTLLRRETPAASHPRRDV